ncbi:MAG: hypothetical protein CM15mP13_2420 [Pseudomonadota bacterium]|nr:MAG: hypothetical protein CM15mP13_2420 [Pseudomonadota bacterium]
MILFKSKSTSSPQKYIKEKNLSCLVESFTLPRKKNVQKRNGIFMQEKRYLANQGFIYIEMEDFFRTNLVWFRKENPQRKLCGKNCIEIKCVIWQREKK